MKEIIMTYKKFEPVAVFEKLLRKEIKQEGAAVLLDLTVRQVKNKLRNYESTEIASLVHKNKGRPSPRKWDSREEKKALKLLRDPLYLISFLSEILILKTSV